MLKFFSRDVDHHLLSHSNTQKGVDNRILFIGDVIGWVGAVALLTAYGLISYGVLDGRSIIYQLINLVGAIGLLVLAVVRRAIPSAATNVIWIIIGIVAIVGIIFR
ncbi:hypothetical protein FWF48_02455 [Candidatus Saccharibacteria bacterium]|nr:hypothetical protein [Candidatus Saccharibacteria bacterium]